VSEEFFSSGEGRTRFEVEMEKKDQYGKQKDLH